MSDQHQQRPPPYTMPSPYAPSYTTFEPPVYLAGAPGTKSPVSPKSWLLAFWLCLLLGWVGAHRFYTGYMGIGLVQSLTAGGFVVWWMMDLYAIWNHTFVDVMDQPLYVGELDEAQMRGQLVKGIGTVLKHL